MPNYVIGIDSGGTFTDCVLVGSGVPLIKHKVPSTPDAPAEGVMRGLGELAGLVGESLPEFLRNIALIVHGTTVTTNAVLTHNGANTWLLTTEGFKDILEMRRGIRGVFYDNKYVAPPVPIPRNKRLTAAERIDADGSVVKPLDKESLRAAVAEMRAGGAEAVAVCFMHSYANPAHEHEAAEFIRRELPGVYLTVSADLLAQPRLYHRVSTTALNAYVGPILSNYLSDLVERLSDGGFNGTLLIMQSNGGVATPAEMKRSAVTSLLSGPAAAPAAALTYAESEGFDNCIVIDMGGTSFDCSLIRDGKPFITRERELERNMVSVPMLEIHTVGAGGGSIAWLDDGGLLRVGPQSAGAVPGPACYPNGGDAPTVTDASVVLGYLNPDNFLGGRIRLNGHRARQIIQEQIGDPLGLTPEEAAWGIYRVAIAQMADAIREITVEKGYDPRDFVLVAGGGAGSQFAALIAQELDIHRVLIPQESAIMCAAGMLAADLRYDYVHTYFREFQRVDMADLLDVFRRMAAEATADLEAAGLELEEIGLTYYADVRYTGQHDEITVPLDLERLRTEGMAAAAHVFHGAHQQLYGYSLEDAGTPLELVCLRVSAHGIRAKIRPEMGEALPEETAPSTWREMYLPEQEGTAPVQVFDATAMGTAEIEGPAVIERVDTTIIVPAAFSARKRPNGTIVLQRKAAPGTEGER